MTFFDGLKRYVGFTEADADVLRAFKPVAEPHFERISEHFYERILHDADAHHAITGGEAQVERLKRTLVLWMASGLEGPHDEAFFERRSRIGRVHVQISLPQHFMITAMDVMRVDFRQVVERQSWPDPARRRHLNDALDRLFDLELAIMLETYREDSEVRLRRRERLATIGQVAAGIGHDLRNPLGVIESSLYLLRRMKGDDPKVERHLERISEQVRISNGIISDLLEMARDRPLKRTPVPVPELFDEAVRNARLPAWVRLSVEAPADLTLDGDRGLLRQALVNLLTNAVAALEGREGEVVLGAEARDGELRLWVADAGRGFAPDALAQAFEPLFTTRSKGIGLGLSLVRSIAQRHGGRVDAANRPQGGAVVTLWLPVQPA